MYLKALFPALSAIVSIFVVEASVIQERASAETLTCGNPANARAFRRAFSASGTDHFYTTNTAEFNNAVQHLGYSAEGIAAYIYPNQEPSTVPLYRLFSPGVTDHFYTTSAPERDTAARSLGYVNEGIAGYVYANANCGGLPLYRLYSGGWTDHFYTTSAAERDNAVAHVGYSFEGIAAYVIPA